MEVFTADNVAPQWFSRLLCTQSIVRRHSRNRGQSNCYYVLNYNSRNYVNINFPDHYVPCVWCLHEADVQMTRGESSIWWDIDLILEQNKLEVTLKMILNRFYGLNDWLYLIKVIIFSNSIVIIHSHPDPKMSAQQKHSRPMIRLNSNPKCAFHC